MLGRQATHRRSSFFWVGMKRLAVASEPPGGTSGFWLESTFLVIWAVSYRWESYSWLLIDELDIV